MAVLPGGLASIGGKVLGTIKFGIDYTAQVYGRPIPLSQGQRAIDGVPLWSSPIRQTWVHHVVPGGQGFSGWYERVEQEYRDFAVSFGKNLAPEGEHGEVKLLRLWVNNKIVFDARDPAIINSNPQINFTFYSGSSAQLPDPVIVADKGAVAPAHKGLIYMVFKNWALPATLKVLGGPVPAGYKFDSNIPVVRAELVDGLIVAPAITDFTMLAGSNVRPNGTCADWSDNTIFGWSAVTTSAAVLHEFDAASGAETKQTTVVGGYSNLDGTDSVVLYDYRNKTFIACKDETSNTEPLVLITRANATIVSTFGASSAATSPTSTTVPRTVCGAVSYLGDGGPALGCFVAGSTFNDVTPLTYINNVWLDKLRADGNGTVNVATFSLGSPNNLFFVMDIPLYKEAERQARARTGEAATQAIFQDGAVVIGHGTIAEIVYFGLRKDIDGTKRPSILGRYTIKDFGGTEYPKYCIVDPVDQGIIIFTINGSDWKAYKFFSTWSTGEGTQTFLSDTFQGLIPLVKTLPRASGQSGPLDSILYAVSIPEMGLSFRPTMSGSNFSVDTLAYHSAGTDITIMTLSNGATATYTGVSFNWDDFVWDGRKSVIYAPHGSGSNRVMASVSLSQTKGEARTLADYLRWLSLKFGYTEAQLDIDSNLNDSLVGMFIDHSYDMDQLFGALGDLYDFRYFTSANKLKFTRVARGDSAPAASFALTRDDMMQVTSQDPFPSVYDTLITTLSQPAQQIGALAVQYYDVDQNYSLMTQTFRLDTKTQNTAATGVTNLPVPVIFHTNEALNRVSKAVIQTTQQAVTQEFRLPWKFSRMEPGDVITITIPPFSYTVQVDEVTFNADKTLSCLGLNYAFTDNIPASTDANINTQQDLKPGSGDSLPVALDMPLLTIALDPGLAKAIVMTGVQSLGQPFFTAAALQSAKEPAALAPLYQADLDVRYGTVAGALADTATPFLTDEGTVLTLACATASSSDFVSAATVEDFHAGKNALIIGSAGQWELVYFRDVTVVNSKVVKLSGLLRGRRGTDPYVGTHAQGERFYLYASASSTFRSTALQPQYLPAGDNGSIYDYRAVGNPTDTTPQTVSVAFSAQSLKPWKPWQVKAVLAGGNDINLTWLRRDRIGGEFVTNDQPMTEASEKYDLEIMSGSSIVRTVSGLTSAARTYTSAQQVADGFTPPLSTLKVRVYQVSALVGRGYVQEVTCLIT